MTPSLSSLILLSPLLLYLLHALWRLIASDSVTAVLAVVSAYVVSAVFFRLYLPSLALVPVWLPLFYAYLWLGLAGALALLGCGEFRRSGVLLRGLSLKMGSYFLSQACLLAGMLLLNPLLAGRPLQALATLPPFVALTGYALYRTLLAISRPQQRTPWWGILFALLVPPLLLGWIAEILVPLFLRYL